MPEHVCSCGRVQFIILSIYSDTVQSQVSQFNVEDLVIDHFYWFDKSTKRKASLSDYYTFCDVTYRDIVV